MRGKERGKKKEFKIEKGQSDGKIILKGKDRETVQKLGSY